MKKALTRPMYCLFWFFLSNLIPLLRPALWSDDYVLIAQTREFTESLFGDLRPVWASLNLLILDFQNFIDPKLLTRTLAVLFLYLTHLTLMSLLATTHANTRILELLFLIAWTIPSITIYMHWTVFWQNSLALYLSVLSITTYLNAISKPIPIQSYVFFALSFAIYPPSAFASLGFLGIFVRYNLLKYSFTSKDFRRLLQLVSISSILSLLLSYFASQIADVQLNARVSILEFNDLFAKFVYVIKVAVLPLNLFSVTSPSANVHLIISLIAGILVLRSFYPIVQRPCFTTQKKEILLSILLGFVSFAPILVTGENQIELRLIPGYAIFITWIVLFESLTYLKSKLIRLTFLQVKLIRNSYPEVLLIMILLLTTMLSTVRYLNFFSYQYEFARNYIYKEIQSCSQNNYGERSILISRIEIPSLTNRLGIYSMKTDFASPWVPEAAMNMLGYNRDSIKRELEFTENSSDSIICKLDLNEMQDKMKWKWIW